MSMLGIMADSKQQGPPFDPTQLPGLMAWFDASDPATIIQTANAVSQWNDKSPNGYHVTQPTGTAQPLTNTTNINGKNTLLFDGTDDFLSRAPCQIVNPTTGEWSSFGVVRLGSVTGSRKIFDQDAVTGAGRIAVFLLTGTTNMQGYAISNTQIQVIEGNPASAIGVPYYAACIRSTTNIELWRNGGTNGGFAITDPGATGTYNLGIGAGRTGGPAGAFYLGEVGELFVYNTALSSADRIKVQNYMKAKWGL